MVQNVPPTAFQLLEFLKEGGSRLPAAAMLFFKRDGTKILEDFGDLKYERRPLHREMRDKILALVGEPASHTPQSASECIQKLRSLFGLVSAIPANTSDNANPDYDWTPPPPHYIIGRCIVGKPQDPGERLRAADFFDEDHQGPRAALLRIEAALQSPDLNLQTRNSLERDRHRFLYEHLKNIFQCFSLPWPEDWTWDEETHTERRVSRPDVALTMFASLDTVQQVDILDRLLRLPEQCSYSHAVLQEHQLVTQNEQGIYGFAGENGEWFPIRDYEALLRQLRATPDKSLLFLKALQGLSCVLDVPLRPIPDFSNALRTSISARRETIACTDDRGHLHLLHTEQKPIADDPVWMWDGWANPNAHIFPLRSGEAQPLAAVQNAEQGFRLMLVEDTANTPHRDDVPVILAGRERIRGGQMGAVYHRLLHPDDAQKSDGQYTGEQGEPIQGEQLRSLIALRRGILPNAHPKRFADSWCTGSQSSGLFGSVCWYRGNRQLLVNRNLPAYGDVDAAPRSSVGV